jgi:anti-sigma factor RsiW
MTSDADIHEEFEAQLSDLHDGTLAEPARTALLAHLESCAACKASYEELKSTLAALSSMKGKPPAPEQFTEQVTETIHKRSAGRFFGRKTLGDRVPFGVLLVIALAVLIAIAIVLWSSSTGSLKVGH